MDKFNAMRLNTMLHCNRSFDPGLADSKKESVRAKAQAIHRHLHLSITSQVFLFTVIGRFMNHQNSHKYR